MTTDITDFLSFEIKKELADRYFGFRKLIEEDKEELERKINHLNCTVGQRIVVDLSRIYLLLQDEGLIDRFVELAGLVEKHFYDPYVLGSPTLRSKLFAGVKPRGLTAGGRFKNLMMQIYEQLVADVADYREKHAELVEIQEMIEEEIRLFYKKNDICTIMSFLRTMEAPPETGGHLEGSLNKGFSDSFEKKMQVHPPLNVCREIPPLPPLPPLAQIKKQLKKIADMAYQSHGKDLGVV